MSEKNSKDQNNQPDNDEDFGLPPVNVTPLGSSRGAKNTKAAFSDTKSKKQGSASEDNDSSEKDKDNTNSIFLVILLLILALGFGLYYFGIFDRMNQQTPMEAVRVEEEPQETTPAAPVTPEPAPEPVEELPVAEEEITTPVLTEIEARVDAPRYFVVVGSFIDDDLARDYSDRLNKQGEATFLVHPYGKIHYFRLAVGQYENVGLALEAMEGVQGNYEENLWVLKY
jgi:cell division septation protein DedD